MTGPAWGLLGTALGMVRTFVVIETSKSPQPEDLDAGVELARNTTAMGIGAFVLGAAILALAVLDLLRRRWTRA